jgi:nitrogen fixation NifU-like protein
MSSDLANLYQEVIIDHSRSPQNFRILEDATGTAVGFNPLCGDQLTLYVKLSGDSIEDVAFQGAGCAISQASASLMTTALKGRTREEALDLWGRVHAMLTGVPNNTIESPELGKLAVLSGVSEFPMRVKCATLAWHALQSALEATGEHVSTE